MEGSPQEVFLKIDQLRKLRLDAPQMVQLANLLRKEGFPIPNEIMSVEEMLQWVCENR